MPEESLVDNPSLPFGLRTLEKGKEVAFHRLEDAPSVRVESV